MSSATTIPAETVVETVVDATEVVQSAMPGIAPAMAPAELPDGVPSASPSAAAQNASAAPAASQQARPTMVRTGTARSAFQQAPPPTEPPAGADPSLAAPTTAPAVIEPVPPLNPVPAGALPCFGVVDFSKDEGGGGQYVLGADAASLEHYLAETAAFERQTVRWVHLSWARAVAQRAIASGPSYPPTSAGSGKGSAAKAFYNAETSSAGLDQGLAEADRMIQLARSLATFKSSRPKPARTFQKQTLSIDEFGVSLSIPVYAEDRLGKSFARADTPKRRAGGITPRPLHPVPTAIQYADRTGTPFRVGSSAEVMGGPDVEFSVRESVLEALSRIEGRLLKRGRLELRLEFVRGWRVDDIRMLLITSLSLLDDELDDDLFADLQGSILSTVNLYPDAPSLIGAILRSMLEVSAEVVTFLEESFSDAESLVFAKPTTIYQQALTQMKAELLVVRRDYAVMRTQVQALAGFLQGVAPSGSAWSGSVINLESIANEEVVLDSRLDALIQRCDACVGLVQFEVSYFQNRIMFALTAVSAVFLPASFFVTFVFPSETVTITQTAFWIAVFVIMVGVSVLLFLFVSPKRVWEWIEESLYIDADRCARSTNIFFTRLGEMIDKDYGGVDTLTKARALEQAGGVWTGKAGEGRKVGNLV
ncbi:hypothetical protein DFJ74DRAFT_742402 [Hyaloraphidium curvatum]|nr:hypothetical protein DFJ74DRAFT_742402 [Hyaloraphidium curvatum]